MKLDPKERIIAAALNQAALNQADERGAGARIEFSRDGHAGLPDNRVGLNEARMRRDDLGNSAGTVSVRPRRFAEKHAADLPGSISTQRVPSLAPCPMSSRPRQRASSVRYGATAMSG